MRLFDLLALGLLSLAAAPATAETITFDDITSSGNAVFTSTTSGGFSFTGDHFHIIDNPGASGLVGNGTKYLGAEAVAGFGQPVNFARTDGALFSLTQADVAELWLPGNPNNNFLSILFTGMVSGGGTLSLLFTYDAIRDGNGGLPDFQTITFAGWDNLTTVNVAGRNAAGAFGDFSIDNIVVNVGDGAVPEPATWAMMIAGFGLVGGALRRRAATLALA